MISFSSAHKKTSVTSLVYIATILSAILTAIFCLPFIEYKKEKNS
jgi:hypothetical protein